MKTLRLLLVLGLPPLALQLASPAPRKDADAVLCFAQVRSLYFDHELFSGGPACRA